MDSSPSREGQVHRQTRETDIRISLLLDGTGEADSKTGVSFLDHMLTLFAVHGYFNLTVAGQGDVEVDDHHTVEDVGICLGQALKAALGDYGGINRYGHSQVPMDEALAMVSLDISNRPFLHYEVPLTDQKVGSFDTALVKEFLRAFALHGGLTLHVNVMHGENAHHMIEAVFKSLGRALSQATMVNPRIKGPLSSKGTL